MIRIVLLLAIQILISAMVLISVWSIKDLTSQHFFMVLREKTYLILQSGGQISHPVHFLEAEVKERCMKVGCPMAAGQTQRLPFRKLPAVPVSAAVLL